MSTPNALRLPRPPWLYVATAEEFGAVEDAEWRVRGLDGSRMRTKAALLDEFERGLEFPGWFGHNWDALEDCLGDREVRGASGLLVVIAEADCVLADAESGELRTLFDILEAVGQFWSEPLTLAARQVPAAPFHVLFLESRDPGSDSLTGRSAQAGRALPRLPG